MRGAMWWARCGGRVGRAVRSVGWNVSDPSGQSRKAMHTPAHARLQRRLTRQPVHYPRASPRARSRTIGSAYQLVVGSLWRERVLSRLARGAARRAARDE